jgi:hypothetical protein
MKLYLKIFLLLVAIKSYSQCTGALVGYFPATVNGVTITESIMGAVGAGSPNPANTYTYCGVISRSIQLGGGVPSSFTQTLNFSSPVNNIIYILTASDCSSTSCESFSFTVNAGTLSCTQSGSACLFQQSSNNFIADTSGGLSNDAYITLSSTMPYTSITVSGPGGNNGSFMSLCANSVTITGIKNNAIDNSNINLYPNPNNGTMTLEYNITKDAYLEISNTNGTLVGKYTLSSSGNKLDVKNDNLGSGVYLYRVVNDAVLKTGRIVIIK